MTQEQPVLPRANDLLQLAATPVQVIEHPSWTTARDAALALLAAGPCVIVLLGPPGSGKTMLLRNLEVALGAQGRTACLLDFGDIQREVGAAEIVLVDEADRISAARLDELSLYDHGARALVLAALPAAGERFRRYPGAIVVEFATLSPDQACEFLAERLAQLGLPVRCLSEAAWAGLVAHGRGVPRLLIALLGLALFVAAEDGAEQVTDAHVEQAVAVRIGGAEPAEVNSDPPALEAPGLPAADRSADAAADHVPGGTRSGWYTRTAAVLVLCLLVPGALLTGSRTQETGPPMPRESGASAVARVEAAAPAAVTPEQSAQNATAVAAAPPEAAGAAVNPPVSPTAGPNSTNVDASQEVVSPAPATVGPVAAPPAASATAHEAASQPATPPDAATKAPVAHPTTADQPASQPVTPPAAATAGPVVAPTTADQPASQPVTPPVSTAATPVTPQPPAPAAASEATSKETLPPTPELPAGALIHIVLIYPRGDHAAAERGRDLAQTLRSAGLGVGDPFPVASRAAKPGISYYFAQDQDAAGGIGRRLGGKYGEGKLIRPPRGAGLPRPGTIEISIGSG